MFELTATVKEKGQAQAEKPQCIEQLLDYTLLLRKRPFGASSERLNKEQVNQLFSGLKVLESEAESTVAEEG